jgi:hypothetical protein
LKNKVKNDTMNALREKQKPLPKVALPEGQSMVSRDDIDSSDVPSLSYEQAASADGEARIHKAFDILFQEVMRIRKSKIPNEINSHIRPSFDRPAGGGKND